jgi:Fic family protein
MNVINFSKNFGSRLDLQGEEHGPILEDLVRETAAEAIVAFDLRGIKYLGYSYAKPTVRKILKRRNRGEYGERRLFLISQIDDLFLEGIHAALKEEKLIMHVSPSPSGLGRDGRLIGKATQALNETFDVLLRRAPITTGGLANCLDISPQNAKNRIDRLLEMGIVAREKVQSSTGGYEWLNRVLPRASDSPYLSC